MRLVETDIGTIAPNWKVVPLKDVAEKPQYGLTAKAAKSGATQFLRITDITDPPDAVFASYLIRVRAGENLEPGFLIQFFQSKGYRRQADANKHANLKKGVNGSILSEMFVPLPTLDAQKEIAAAFIATDQKVQTAAAKRDALKDLFLTLLHELMTAKTRVTMIPSETIAR